MIIILKELKKKEEASSKSVYFSYSATEKLINEEGWECVSNGLHDILKKLYDNGYLTIKPASTTVGFNKNLKRPGFDIITTFDCGVSN